MVCVNIGGVSGTRLKAGAKTHYSIENIANLHRTDATSSNKESIILRRNATSELHRHKVESARHVAIVNELFCELAERYKERWCDGGSTKD